MVILEEVSRVNGKALILAEKIRDVNWITPALMSHTTFEIKADKTMGCGSAKYDGYHICIKREGILTDD